MFLKDFETTVDTGKPLSDVGENLMNPRKVYQVGQPAPWHPHLSAFLLGSKFFFDSE
jgi:hypothetical protein